MSTLNTVFSLFFTLQLFTRFIKSKKIKHQSNKMHQLLLLSHFHDAGIIDKPQFAFG